MRNYSLSCPALSASLDTHSTTIAACWLADVLATCPVGASVSVKVNGIERGARIAARLMSLTVAEITRAIDAETLTRKAA